MRLSKKTVDVAFGLLGIALAAAAFHLSRNFPKPLDGQLGAAVFPRIVGALLGCVSIAIIAGAVTRDREVLVIKHWLRVAGAFLATLAYTLALPGAGFLVATPLFLAAVIMLAGCRSPFRISLVAIVVTAAVYVSFKILLESPLPDGFLFAPEF